MDKNIKCRFRVDRDLCIAISACIVAEPDVYILDDEAKAVINPMNFEDFQEILREAEGEQWVTVLTNENGFNRIVDSARVCPVLAIFVEREEDGVWVNIYPD